MEYDAVRTIDLALRLHPRATQLVLVTGASEWDRRWGGALAQGGGDLRGSVRTWCFLPDCRWQPCASDLPTLARMRSFTAPGFTRIAREGFHSCRIRAHARRPNRGANLRAVRYLHRHGRRGRLHAQLRYDRTACRSDRRRAPRRRVAERSVPAGADSDGVERRLAAGASLGDRREDGARRCHRAVPDAHTLADLPQ